MIRASRRELLAGLLASSLLPLRARGEEPPSLRPGEILADPDFAALRTPDPHLVGVRPHRVGGVRLELEQAPLEGPDGRKYLIHDYGHGGAGVTLAFGSAAVVADLVRQALDRLGAGTRPRIAVVGTGVAGLAAASEIRRRWPEAPLTVHAKDLDVRKTTSWVAGGQFEPSGIWREYQDPQRQEVLASLLRRSRDRILALGQEGLAEAHGIAPRDNYTLDHPLDSLDRYTPADVVAPYRTGRLPFARLSVVGRQYRTWLVNPTILLPRLANDLASAGVRFEQRTLSGRADLAALPGNVVVNCTGYGAKQLVGDPALAPQRGHLVALRRTAESQDWFFSGGCENHVISYVFCRQDDIVVGGTVLGGQDQTVIGDRDRPIFERILANAREVFGGHPAACAA